MAAFTNKRKRILLTSLSGQLGGMELRLADEARFLSKIDLQPVLSVSPFPGRDPWLDGLVKEIPNCETYEFNPPPFFDEWKWHRFNFVRANARWPIRLRQQKIDLAHIFYAWTSDGGSRLWLCHKAGIPCVLSVHNAFPTERYLPWHDRLMREAFASVKGLYGVSESALDHFLATYGRYIRTNTELSVIPNFADTARFIPSPARRQSTKDALGIPEEGIVIGSIGRIEKQKEPLKLLEVFNRIWQSRTDVFLVLCGKGPLAAEVEKIVDGKPWRSQVRLLGFRPDVENVFPAIDIHVLLSKQEGFGIATAEAMSCAVPVIATDVPGSRDVLKDSNAGMLVPYGDLETTIKTILWMIESPDQRRVMGESGRDHVLKYFSKSICEQNLDCFYNKMLSANP